MKMVKLTRFYSAPKADRHLWANMDRVHTIFIAEGYDERNGRKPCTRIAFSNGDYWDVVETPDEIAKMCNHLS